MHYDHTEALDALFDDDDAVEPLTREALQALREERARARAQERETRYGATLDDAIATFNVMPSPHQLSVYMGQRGLQYQRDMVQGVAELIVQRMQITDSVTSIALRDLYTQYRRYEQMVKHNIAQFEGGACSTDKARVLLNRIYPAYLTGASNLSPHTDWNTPQADTHDLWCAVIRAYGRFDMGDHQAFVDSWRNLVNMYQHNAPECQFCGR